jgi:hypothetical protein
MEGDCAFAHLGLRVDLSVFHFSVITSSACGTMRPCSWRSRLSSAS